MLRRLLWHVSQLFAGVLIFCFAATAANEAGATEAATRPAAAIRAVALTAGDHLRHLSVGGLGRSYFVHVPKGYDLTKPTPVVLAFHGAWMNGAMMATFCALSEKADAAGFIVAYPNGTGFGDAALFFNAWSAPRPEGPPDDVIFTAKLLDDLASVTNVDPKRVFATGMSNGGMMCHRLAAELSDRIAAIAAVSGTLSIPQCNPTRPVPVIHFHGTADRIVPFGGPNPNGPRLLKFKSVEQTIKTWCDIDGCPAEPRTTEFPDTAHDGTSAVQKVYGPGKQGAEVVLIQVEGGGHTWPGRQPPVRFIGKSTMNISANDLIWDFFCKHPMK
jgi:polyhydroxybutyrate depolymerase